MENRFDPACFDRAALEARVADGNYLLVEVGALPSWARGSLDDYLGSRIEERLAAVDALGRSGSVPRDFERQLEDQLYRARLVGFDGIALDVGSLSALAHEGVVRSDDSQSVRRWLELQDRLALHVGLPEATRELLGFTEPAPLGSWFVDSAAEAESVEPAEPLPVPEVLVLPPAPAEELLLEAGPSAPPAPSSPAAAPEPQGELLITRTRSRAPNDPATRQISLFAEAATDAAAVTVSDEVSHSQRVRDWCSTLECASGTTSFAALEELFVGAYSPLESALCSDGGHGAERGTLARWSDRFGECYRSAFEKLRTSRQRPRMVFDAPKIAFQLGRAHDANGFELVLVDAFRFDVGQRVHDKLRLQLSGVAECVERGVLWSPLPSTTAAGLELLARGADGLRDLRADIKEAAVVSIKEARRLRKLRAGPHSLFKLDAVQVLLEPGKAWDARGLDQLAAEVSVSAARFIRQRPQGTLVFLFGDHGFRLDDGGHGGASPSEVLVPFQAWHVVGGAREVAAE